MLLIYVNGQTHFIKNFKICAMLIYGGSQLLATVWSLRQAQQRTLWQLALPSSLETLLQPLLRHCWSNLEPEDFPFDFEADRERSENK